MGPPGAIGPKGDKGDPASDDQQLSTDNTPGNLTISDGNMITINVNDSDASITNEIQTLSFSNNNLTISGIGGNTVALDQVNLSQSNLTQSSESRIYNINSQKLGFTNGDVGIGTSAPTSRLQVNGAFSTPIRTTVANTTLDANDYTLIMKQKNLVISLPDPNLCPGRLYVLVNISSGNNQTNMDYICNKGSFRSSLNRNKSIWLQSTGNTWQQINIQ